MREKLIEAQQNLNEIEQQQQQPKDKCDSLTSKKEADVSIEQRHNNNKNNNNVAKLDDKKKGKIFLISYENMFYLLAFVSCGSGLVLCTCTLSNVIFCWLSNCKI